MPLLSIQDLSVAFHTDLGVTEAVKKVSFDLAPGETLALVGESGSGKSVTAASILRLLPATARTSSGSIDFQGRKILDMDEAALRDLRGNDVAMIFQEPMTALNPVYPVARQLIEAIRLHQEASPAEARKRAIALLERCGLPDAAARIDAFPHQFSGGQRQRILIAMALACRPALLIADEPTTALDVTIKAQILALLKELQEEFGMAVLLITHDLPMVEKVADRVAVMRLGEIVESGTLDEIFKKPKHPYTRQLLDALPDDAPPEADPRSRVLFQADDVKVHFPIKKGFFKRTVGQVKAVDGVTLTLRRGQTVGVVGESGSGKTTLGEGMLRLIESRGELRFDGEDLHSATRGRMRALRRRMQVVFQDPFSSLSPRMTIGEILAEGLEVHGLAGNPEIIAAALTEVGLEPAVADRYPHEFSGGQRQRIAIARAMALKPDLIVLDEPTSALDLSVQAQILDLLRKLQKSHGLAYLFISHDLRVIRALSHEVIVMHNGEVVEQGPTEEIFQSPKRPYTRKLLAAALDPLAC